MALKNFVDQQLPVIDAAWLTRLDLLLQRFEENGLQGGPRVLAMAKVDFVAGVADIDPACAVFGIASVTYDVASTTLHILCTEQTAAVGVNPVASVLIGSGADNRLLAPRFKAYDKLLYRLDLEFVNTDLGTLVDVSTYGTFSIYVSLFY